MNLKNDKVLLSMILKYLLVIALTFHLSGTVTLGSELNKEKKLLPHAGRICLQTGLMMVDVGLPSFSNCSAQ